VGGSRRAWGWHPLVDEWAGRIVADAAIRPGELVLDLGAGDGALTGPLVAAGARVVAVELHPGRAQRLRERFAGTPVAVVAADATRLRLPGRPFRVVASPPYRISSALLRTLLAPGSRLVRADLVLQRALVRRLVAAPTGYAAAVRRFAAAGSGRWELTAGRSLPRRAFRPPPQVDSAVLVVRRR
jgi:23S rRNA (adenine-N6)-dimethyltransferase